MKLLFSLDKNDYQGMTEKSERSAVRAIIFKNGLLAMVKSQRYGFYKFPGGGVGTGESHLQTLLREVREETGLTIVPDSVKAFGKVREIKRDLIHENKIFHHTSFYYFAEAEEGVSPQELDEYEADLGYHLEYVTPEEAYKTNLRLSAELDISYIYREAKVLETLLKK